MKLEQLELDIEALDKYEDLYDAHQAVKRKASVKRKNNAKAGRRRKEIILTMNQHGYNPLVGWYDFDYVDGKWQRIGNYVKYPRNSKGQRYLKRKTHKRNRRIPIGDEDRARKGNSYRRSVDYWWELY